MIAGIVFDVKHCLRQKITNPQTKGADLPTHINYRPITSADLPLLFEIYRHTRLHELSAVEWSDEQKNRFLLMQFETQHRYYQQAHGNDDFLLILVNNVVIGRLYLGHWEEEIRIIDISLLPRCCGGGIGTKILSDIIEQARQQDKFVSIHVEKNNPALRLYQRLGFVAVADTGVYWRMHRQTTPMMAI
jgi:ribosomal protein S18 acetylase RimI-like enzyme